MSQEKMNQPEGRVIYKHDCDVCVSLGPWQHVYGKIFDLYWCCRGPTLISRHGDQSYARSFYPLKSDSQTPNAPSLREAMHRAKILGLVNRIPSEPPQEVKAEWRDEPEESDVNVMWWYGDKGIVRMAMVRNDSAEIEGTNNNWLEELPGKWHPWSGVRPEPYVEPEKLPELAVRGFARCKKDGTQLSAVRWPNVYGEQWFTIHVLDNPINLTPDDFNKAFDWLTEAEAQEQRDE